MKGYSDLEQINKRFLPTRFRKMLLVFFAFIIFYLVSYILNPYSDFWKEYLNRTFYEIVIEWIVTFLFCYLITESSILIHKKLNQRVPWTQNKSKRLLLEVSFNFGVVVILIMMNMLCFSWIYSDLPDTDISMEEIKGLLQWIVISLVISFMIISINTVSYLIDNWIDTYMEMSQHKVHAVELRQASVEAELNTLKLQLDPHFIFNNLSVLSELILEDQQLGFEYSENFAKVYRFLLVNSKKNLISLEEEIKFLRAYIFLIENRVGIGVHFSIEIDERSKHMYIPPLTLQLLIENAIKHNATQQKNPLMISIYNPEVDQVVIENTRSPIDQTQIASTGIGLKNMNSRFKLLGKKIPKVFQNEHIFKVSIQLIAYDRENSNS
ncbi:MAG TPA: histidine kinase [Sphingobacterium sp.]|uniref:sensor histidine kinase n=1 Tax=Sphingobacterium faecium TaxID=34087 RepID=UPI00097F2B01|nr:histidine kinase [Sphingobacterium faecium]MQP26365.1 histidine kinase [Sphingobacterium faecium]SJN25046.1 putative two-component system sensor protein histidine kinase [Sphingobacterium faecium PCAi_F2.5]HCU46629.1 histidine kinase [Sphingobacterium sp.]